MTSIRNQLASKNNPAAAALMRAHDGARRRLNINHRPQVAAGFLKDGVDHINIWALGQTDLGRELAMETEIGVNLPGLGKFSSIFALWTFLTTENRSELLRTAPAYALREFLRRREEEGNVVDFMNARYICAMALASHINNNPVVRDALIDSDGAEFTNYIEMRGHGPNGGRMQHPHASWWIPVVRLCRATVTAHGVIEASDFYALRDTDETEDQIFVPIYEVMEQKLGAFKKPAKVEKPKKENKPKVKSTNGPRELSERERRLSEELEETGQSVALLFESVEKRAAFISTFLGSEDRLTTNFVEENIEPDDPTTPGAVKLWVNIVDGKVVSLSTAVFDNPYSEENSPKVSVNSEEEFAQAVKTHYGLSDEAYASVVIVKREPKNRKGKSEVTTETIAVATEAQETEVQETDVQELVTQE